MESNQEFWTTVLVGGWISLIGAIVIYQILESRQNKKK